MEPVLPAKPNFAKLRSVAVMNNEHQIIDRLEVDYAIACNLAIIASVGLSQLNAQQMKNAEKMLKTYDVPLGSTIGSPANPEVRAADKAAVAAANAKAAASAKDKDDDDDDDPNKETII